MNVVSRILGILLAALSAEMILAGLITTPDDWALARAIMESLQPA